MPRFPSLLLAITLAGTPAAAQDLAAPAPSVDDLVREALARSPAIGARAASVDAQRQRQQAAGALADPGLDVELQNAGLGWSVGDQEMSMVELQVRQPLPWPGKRDAARAVAAAETRQQEAAHAAVARDVALSVRTIYARIYALDREREALLASGELIDLLTETARSRYATGGGEQEGVLKAGVQGLRVKERMADLDAERESLVADLDRWLDLPGSAPLGRVGALDPAPAPPAVTEQQAADRAPEVLQAASAVDVAERRVEAARLGLRPDLSVNGGVGYRGSLDAVVLAGVGIELPIWRRQKQLPLLHAAEAELVAAQRRLADTRAAARAEAAKHVAMFHAADAQAQLYRDGIVPQADAALDAARSSYLAGRGDFSTVIEDFQLWLDARVALARREADRYEAWATLQHHVGGVPESDEHHAGDAAHAEGTR